MVVKPNCCSTMTLINICNSYRTHLIRPICILQEGLIVCGQAICDFHHSRNMKLKKTANMEDKSIVLALFEDFGISCGYSTLKLTFFLPPKNGLAYSLEVMSGLEWTWSKNSCIPALKGDSASPISQSSSPTKIRSKYQSSEKSFAFNSI